MNATKLDPTVRTVRVGHRQIHLAEFGADPAVLMLHGGGPGASGLSKAPILRSSGAT